MKKIKEIRQNVSKAVVSGSRSGTGKIFFKNSTINWSHCGVVQPPQSPVLMEWEELMLWKTMKLLDGLWKTTKFLVWIRKKLVLQQV